MAEAPTAATEKPQGGSNFIRDIIKEEMKNGKWAEGIITRFPPEPNGFLHLGHAKSICLNFGLAREFNGRCHLRFDDTNPTKEETEYVDSIKNDVAWLGGDWGVHLYYASDYFQQLYEWAVHLIKTGKAYIDDQTLEQIRANRGNIHEPGTNSPFRDRSVEENLDLFERMKKGEFKEGERVLRAKVDMTHPNMNMRDPILYRILHQEHHRTGKQWCIYPMYDYAHGQSDAIEKITHSICTLEFELHRPLYEWFLDQIPVPARPRQIEFARLGLTYTLMSKRKLLQLVTEKHVRGWDDPRMPTISGMRRRGYTSSAIRAFCELIGVTKNNTTIQYNLLENCLISDLDPKVQRRMVVLDPIKVVLENFPEGEVEWYEAPNHPGNPDLGTRKVPLTRELYIDRDDFFEEPPKKFFRLFPGNEVRLRYACCITCKPDGVVKNDKGEIVELRCVFDPDSRGGNPKDGRKIKGTIHWASASHGLPIEARLYELLFNKEAPEELLPGQKSFLENINPNSLSIIRAIGEPAMKEATVGEGFQFERKGYFCVDPDSTPENPVYNRTIALRDSFAKEVAKK
eukprot:TRINITY_DN83404_c0_g1_i1.p1 TRINITY_DN83404_c0_g1~~TRINITY_DN83404_c0_g1_i1.p1  ORF type:complete len:571 (+),score=113.10 TRINITY_DN83404_c0_g1_i1:80-1792(+)